MLVQSVIKCGVRRDIPISIHDLRRCPVHTCLSKIVRLRLLLEVARRGQLRTHRKGEGREHDAQKCQDPQHHGQRQATLTSHHTPIHSVCPTWTGKTNGGSVTSWSPRCLAGRIVRVISTANGNRSEPRRARWPTVGADLLEDG